jgi:alkyl hydroperoxide reductase subunit AhpC
MIDSTATTPVSTVATSPRSNPLLFLAVCGVFMLTGILFLAWLGTDRSRTAVGKELPTIVLDPLLNTEQSITTEQIVGKPTILYLWSPDSKNAKTELQQIAEIAKNHPEYSLMTIAFSERALVLEVLRDKAKEQLEQQDLDWPTYVDNSGKASMEFAMLMPYGSFGFPTVFVIDQRGRFRYVCEARKPENWQELARQLTQ